MTWNFSVESAEDQWIIDPIIIADTYGPEVWIVSVGLIWKVL